MITAQDLSELAREGIILVVLLSLPVIVSTAVAALVSWLLQSFTKVSDPSLSALPRIIFGAVALIAAAPWIGARASSFAERAWSLLQAVRL